MPELRKLVADIEQLRDEVRLKIHLASRELRDEWTALEKHWTLFEQKAQLHRSAQEVGSALGKLGTELKQAYERLIQAL